MPSSASNLSADRYGYDFVVATTQSSINGAMKSFLASRQEPTVSICYVADDDGDPKEIDYEEFMRTSHGADPFELLDGPRSGDCEEIANFEKLRAARFMAGFRAKLGIPRVNKDHVSEIPDIVVLGTDTASVTFNMLCAEFLIVQLDPGSGYSKPKWTRLEQDRNHPWVFQSKVDLRLSLVDGSAYSKLPPAVQDQIKNLSGTAFSVQQLLFDLTNASLMSIPTIGKSVAPGTLVHTLLLRYFLGAYFAQLQKESQPLLGCSIVPRTADPSTLTLTDMNFNICPYVNENGQPIAQPSELQQKLATLNYLCAADGHSLPPPVKFNWNWVDANELKDHDGVIAINRNSFVKYFETQLRDYVPTVCLYPRARCWQEAAIPKYGLDLTPGASPVVTLPPHGQTVLNMNYVEWSEDRCGLNGALGELKMKSSFDLSVEFIAKDSSIVVTQHLMVWVYLRKNLTGSSANIVDKKIIDTYRLGINAKGQLEADLKYQSMNNPQELKAANAVLDIVGFNVLSGYVVRAAEKVTSTALKDIPISTVQKYIFPGGKTFVFKKVAFSDNHDLVSHISYADPRAPL